MNQVKIFYCAGIMGLGLFLVMLIVSSLESVGAATALTNPIQRPHDPVVVSGADLPAFDQVPINELRLYIYNGVDWQPIPMQIDERVVVSNTAVYTTFEDGLLDANDELVFMGHDADTMASITNWVNNAEARTNPRYALAVTDPLQPSEVGYAYLYHAGTLTDSIANYVAWDHASQTLTALSYTLSFDPNNFAGVADLSLNNNPVDILDRQKIRVVVDPPIFPPVTLTEEDIPGLLGTPVTVTLPIVGQVRAIGGGGGNEFAFYGRRSDLRATLDLGSIQLPIPGTTFEELRTSFDLNDPASTGMTPTLYYDSNTPTGVAVDGSMDAVPNTPLMDWYEISGMSGGFVAIANASAEAGTLTNYYVDNSTPNANDTGDGLSFADAGVHIANPGGVLTVTQALYIISPGMGSQGSTAKNWYDNPLQADVTEEIYPAEHVLTVAKTAVATTSPGDALTYTLTVEHVHAISSTNNLVLTDTMPAGTTFITATGVYTEDGTLVTWTRPLLGNVETWQVQLVVQIPLTTTATTVENVTYGVRSDEVTTVLGEPVITDIVIKPGNEGVYLPFIKR